MNLTFQSDAKEHSAALLEFARYKRFTTAQALRFEGRQLAGLLIKLTPPRNRSQGRAAVARDIRRAIRPLRPQDFDNPKIKSLIRARDYAGLQVVFRRMERGEFRNALVVAFDPAIHRDAQQSRGRVLKAKGVVTPDSDLVRDYIRKIQENVGGGKGGWAESFLHLGGKPAAWISKHRNQGEVEDKADNAVSAYIKMSNESEWAEGGDEDRIVANAIRTRTTAIRTALIKATEKAKQKAGLK